MMVASRWERLRDGSKEKGDQTLEVPMGGADDKENKGAEHKEEGNLAEEDRPTTGRIGSTGGQNDRKGGSMRSSRRKMAAGSQKK